jgi:hypothetical protein
VAAEAPDDLLVAGGSESPVSGNVRGRGAQPSGCTERVARSTASQPALLKITVRNGSLWSCAARWAAVGAPKMYAPSPTVAMTVFSGAPSFAPSAAPRAQPSPPECGDPKRCPGPTGGRGA